MRQCDLFRVLSYHPESGEFTWIKSRRHGFSGRKAGTVNGKGYIQVCIDGKLHLAHRLALLYVTGEMPKEVDHINRVRDDNRIENLRDSISHANNMGNQSIQKRDKSSSYKGVCWDKNRGKWMASIKVNRRRIHLGRFSDETLAAKAYNSAAISAFGVFANINSFDGEK